MKIYVADSDASARQAWVELLPQVVWIDSATELLRRLDGSERDCILIVDARLPDMDAIEAIKELRKRGLEVPVIVICEDADVPTAVRAMQSGASEFLEKPLHLSVLARTIRTLIQAYAASCQRSSGLLPVTG